MQDKYKIVKIRERNKYLEVYWRDNHISKFHFLWLRDNSPTAFHKDTRMRKFNILSISGIGFSKYKYGRNKGRSIHLLIIICLILVFGKRFLNKFIFIIISNKKIIFSAISILNALI